MEENRFELYNKITSLLKSNIPNSKILCIKKNDNTILSLFSKYKYVLNNYIYLDDSGIDNNQSAFGNIYLSKITDSTDNKSYYFITKVGLLTDITINELIILNIVSQNVLKTKNIHLPLIYNDVKCDKIDKSIINLKTVHEKDDYLTKMYLEANTYYSFFIEKEESDIYKLFKKYKNINNLIILNIISQVFMGILSCHSLNIYHHDTHPGNFLFKTIEISKPSCIEYKYKDLTFYIENMGYIIKIIDFGLSIIVSKENKIEKGIESINDYIIFIDTILTYNIIINQKLLLICKGNTKLYLEKKNRKENTRYNIDNNNILNTLNKIKNLYIEKLYESSDNIIDYDTDYEFIKYLIDIGILYSIPIGSIIQTIDLNENMS